MVEITRDWEFGKVQLPWRYCATPIVKYIGQTIVNVPSSRCRVFRYQAKIRVDTGWTGPDFGPDTVQWIQIEIRSGGSWIDPVQLAV
jgi:hypothetical protein